MKTREIALVWYLLSCSVSVLAAIWNNELLLLVVKPTIIPAIFYYYLTTKKTPVSVLFIFILVFNFIGDTIALLRFENQTLLLMIPFFMGYVLTLIPVAKDVLSRKWDLTGTWISLFIFLFLMYVLYELIPMFSDGNPELVIPVVIFGIVLGLLTTLSVYLYAVSISATSFFMLMFVLTSVVSDVFYMLFSFIYKIPFLNYFEFAAQLFSYYFLTKYFVLRRKSPNF